ncbi:MAG: GntR family transcriptional regulator [Terriglobales bacterium]|jgi:DNA-binding transcriptional regulator YhcF (GntR family)
MRLSLSKNSDVPLQQQLTEQLVYLIATGGLPDGKQLPSVRSLARTLGIHHNTVSKAYQDLIIRGWATGRHGSRLSVSHSQAPQNVRDLDGVINQTIQTARQMGYSLQTLQGRVLERLFEQAPDHILVVEEEPELRLIIQAEICLRVGRFVEACSPEQLKKSPQLVVGSQVVAPDYASQHLMALVPKHQAGVVLKFAGADDHIELIRNLAEASMIAMASVSPTLLKTGQSLLAPVLGRRHTFRKVLLPLRGHADLRGLDIVFCDTLAMPMVRCNNKVHYRLVATGCLDDLDAVFEYAGPRSGEAANVELSRRRNRKRS